jgi:hypothetical protein
MSYKNLLSHCKTANSLVFLHLEWYYINSFLSNTIVPQLSYPPSRVRVREWPSEKRFVGGREKSGDDALLRESSGRERVLVAVWVIRRCMATVATKLLSHSFLCSICYFLYICGSSSTNLQFGNSFSFFESCFIFVLKIYVFCYNCWFSPMGLYKDHSFLNWTILGWVYELHDSKCSCFS